MSYSHANGEQIAFSGSFTRANFNILNNVGAAQIMPLFKIPANTVYLSMYFQVSAATGPGPNFGVSFYSVSVDNKLIAAFNEPLKVIGTPLPVNVMRCFIFGGNVVAPNITPAIPTAETAQPGAQGIYDFGPVFGAANLSSLTCPKLVSDTFVFLHTNSNLVTITASYRAVATLKVSGN